MNTKTKTIDNLRSRDLRPNDRLVHLDYSDYETTFTVEREVPDFPVGMIVAVRHLSGRLVGTAPVVRHDDSQWHVVGTPGKISFHTDEDVARYLSDPADPTAILFDPTKED